MEKKYLQGLMVVSVTKGATQKLTEKLSKPIDITIHWKALEEHFFIIPLFSRLKFYFVENMHFLEFSQNTKS
jgi:hypothetical protein